jgi:hypothetical protein
MLRRSHRQQTQVEHDCHCADRLSLSALHLADNAPTLSFYYPMPLYLIGNLFSLPFLLLFYALWILASLFRPLTVISWISFLTHPSAAWRKLELLWTSLQYLAFCKDKKWKKPAEDPASFFEGVDDSQIQRKTVIFIRHGESTWNDTFNKGDRPLSKFIINFVPNLVQSIVIELWFAVTGQAHESWFYDSPLSAKGVQQANTLYKYLQSPTQFLPPKEAEWLQLLQDPSQTQLVSSNLRRAISTLLLAFATRWNNHTKPTTPPLSPADINEKALDSVWIWSCLQEISRNPDALSITPKLGRVLPSWTDPPLLQSLYKLTSSDSSPLVSTSHPGHLGNKAITSTGGERLQEFCRLVFEHVDKPAVVAAGHSLWFKSFFQTYLPYSLEHVSKKKKLVNGGTVGFVLMSTRDKNGVQRFLIDHKSMHVMHGGF